MERKVVSNRTRLLRGFLVLIAMLVMSAVVDWTMHETLRSWFETALAPTTAGGCIGLFLFYLATGSKQRVLKMPEDI
jgi:hypothetical protein